MSRPWPLELLACLGCWLLWLGWLWHEARLHRQRLERIPLRIHVNGTRGKSGVVRLIAAGLRGDGKRVIAKVTGTDPKIIGPDGGERLLRRHGPANIREYLAVISEAAECGAEVLVTECMALRPELQAFCEQRLMKSHIGVITNIRRDHEEIMGPNLADIAVSLGRTVPAQGKLVTIATAGQLLADQGCLGPGEAIVADPESVTQAELDTLPFETERDNLALALTVCELAGVDKTTALAGMRLALPDRGNLTVRDFTVHGRRIRMINAMAANDPDSTLILWHRYATTETVAGVLLNARRDRRLRTRELSRLLAGLWPGPYYLAGDAGFAADCLQQAGVDAALIAVLPSPTQAAALEAVAAGMNRPAGILFAAGNMKGFVA